MSTIRVLPPVLVASISLSLSIPVLCRGGRGVMGWAVVGCSLVCRGVLCCVVSCCVVPSRVA